jgi:uncharacterized alkaline shock family protein YloU
MEKDMANVREDKIRISDEVVAAIAGIAASGVEGVASMSGGLSDGIAGMLGKKNFSKGIKVEVGEKEVTVDLSIIVRYGVKIHLVAAEIQNRVRSSIEEMTGMMVPEVNVNITGVDMGKGIVAQQEEVPEK